MMGSPLFLWFPLFLFVFLSGSSWFSGCCCKPSFRLPDEVSAAVACVGSTTVAYWAQIRQDATRKKWARIQHKTSTHLLYRRETRKYNPLQAERREWEDRVEYWMCKFMKKVAVLWSCRGPLPASESRNESVDLVEPSDWSISKAASIYSFR